MDFEGYIWVLFVIIWIISAIVKGTRKKPGSAPRAPKQSRPAKSPIFAKLQDTFKTLVEELEQPSEDTFDEIPKQQLKGVPQPGEITLPEMPEVAVKRAPARPVGTRPETFYRGQVSQKRLREAIVWSEILRKPLGLRNE